MGTVEGQRQAVVGGLFLRAWQGEEWSGNVAGMSFTRDTIGLSYVSRMHRLLVGSGLLALGLCLQPACGWAAPSVGADSASLYEMPSTPVETRWYTFENPKGLKGQAGQARFGRKGAPATGIATGKSLVLADIEGSGTIRRIWATLFNRDPAALRGLKLEMYWDGAKTPAVQAPFGDFFCHSLGHMVTFENACFASPEGRSFECFVPMPFRKGRADRAGQ